MFETLNAFELPLLAALRQAATPLCDVFFSLVTRLGDGGLFFMLVGVGLIPFKKTRLLGVCVLTALTLEVLCVNAALKPLFSRARPFDVTGLPPLVRAPGGFSFPSGHAGSSFAFAYALRHAPRRWFGAALILAALIAFSRVYLYVHYPTDVLAGALIGAGCGLLSNWLWKKAANHGILV